MKLLEFEYRGETIVFETTNKARAEIKDYSMKNLKDFSAGDYLELMTQTKELEKQTAKIEAMPDGKEKEELTAMLEEKSTEMADKIQAMSLQLDQIELSTLDFMYIILKNTRRYKGNLSREVFDDMIYEMEEQFGDVKTFELLEEAKQKAFTVFEKMTKAEEKMKNPPQKKSSKKSKVN